MKQQHKSQKQEQKLRDIGKLILRFMNKKASKIYNYKQIADGIEYKNPRQRELVIQAHLEGTHETARIQEQARETIVSR